jgi:hypothetical protein
LYGSLIVGSSIGCTTSYWYHGGINMRGLGIGYTYDPTSGLNGGPLGGSPLGELPQGQSWGCPPFGGWWVEPLGTWVGKLVLTYIVVVIGAVTYCWTCFLSLLITSWTIVGN